MINAAGEFCFSHGIRLFYQRRLIKDRLSERDERKAADGALLESRLSKIFWIKAPLPQVFVRQGSLLSVPFLRNSVAIKRAVIEETDTNSEVLPFQPG